MMKVNSPIYEAFTASPLTRKTTFCPTPEGKTPNLRKTDNGRANANIHIATRTQQSNVHSWWFLFSNKTWRCWHRQSDAISCRYQKGEGCAEMVPWASRQTKTGQIFGPAQIKTREPSEGNYSHFGTLMGVKPSGCPPLLARLGDTLRHLTVWYPWRWELDSSWRWRHDQNLGVSHVKYE